MTPKEFDACFDEFTLSAWRLETLQRYSVGEEDERIAAWRAGLPRPERSVRTSPWLRRIAVTTAAGKQWGRLHIVGPPAERIRAVRDGQLYRERGRRKSGSRTVPLTVS